MTNTARKQGGVARADNDVEPRQDEWMTTVEAAAHCHMSKRALLQHVAMVGSCSFHAHLDVCAQCREHPFALCDVGAAALCAEVGGAP